MIWGPGGPAYRQTDEAWEEEYLYVFSGLRGVFFQLFWDFLIVFVVQAILDLSIHVDLFIC